ncbi:MAG TPA: DNA primase [Gammaproteobacteria bacterium]|nr:DNA primase [Gammaproteobacteria bacterium]
MTGTISREFIELLLTKIDLVDLINSQLPLCKKSGSNYFACCPFHNEKSASFSVSQTKQFYYCFGCGAHGNAIDFMMQHDRLSFPEAIEALARYTGMEVPHTNETIKKDRSIAVLHELMQAVAADYYEQMCHATRAINYLKNRGISGSIAQQFNMGYAPISWNHILDKFGKTDADKKNLLDVGLIIKREEGGYYDRFRDRIIFPIHDYRGRIIGFGGRIIDQGEPKYLNSPETILFQKGHELYGLHHAIKMNKKLDRILIVEGYMDVIALFQHHITYTVATLGTATTQHHLHRLLRYTSEIIFCFDGDAAGRHAAWRALQVILPIMQDNLQIRFLFLPDGEDPDSLIRKKDLSQFEKLLNTAWSLSNFFLQTLTQQSDMSTMEGRACFAASAITYIKQIPPGIFQGILLEELSKRARVDLNHLKQQMKLSTTQKTPLTNLVKSSPTKLPASLRLALALLIQHPYLVSKLAKPIPLSSLPGDTLLIDLIKLTQQKPHITTAGLIEYWRGQSEEALIAELANWNHLIPDSGIIDGFLGAIQQLVFMGFDNEINNLLSKAAGEGLSETEKLKLAECISKKKALAEEDVARNL